MNFITFLFFCFANLYFFVRRVLAAFFAKFRKLQLFFIFHWIFAGRVISAFARCALELKRDRFSFSHFILIYNLLIFFVEPRTGLEPVISSLPMMCIASMLSRPGARSRIRTYEAVKRRFYRPLGLSTSHIVA